MKPLEKLLKNAARSRFRIVLSEGADPRAVEAALAAAKDGIAQMALVGPQAEIEAELHRQNAPSDHGVALHDPTTSPLLPELSSLFHKLRAHKGVTAEQAQEAAQNPHVFAALLVKSGHADGTVGGAVATTADIVRTAIQVIGPAPGSKLVSSFFLMLFCAEHHAKKGAHIFADSGLVVDPNAEEMAQIAAASAASFEAMTGDVARVAMLSFSTHGSASHNAVSKVVTATELARNSNPSLLIDGELQFDAAFDPAVAEKKAGLSPLKGEANVFIFPNLESGNIAYKIAQRVGGAVAIGPILQVWPNPQMTCHGAAQRKIFCT